MSGQPFQRLVNQLTGCREVAADLGQPRPEVRLLRPPESRVTREAVQQRLIVGASEPVYQHGVPVDHRVRPPDRLSIELTPTLLGLVRARPPTRR